MAIVWNRDAAAHLYRRAGFGATPQELDRALEQGMEATVAGLIDYEGVDNSALEARLAALGPEPATAIEILTWWLTRMVFTARPLEERMTFFLHDHFATGLRKVQRADWMLGQNRLLREFALGDFTELTIEVSRDPAMLIWLDNFTSRKQNPNENFGRELLELFTLGHGNYSEADVKAATRAFTGWTISRQTGEFTFIDPFHDHGQKTFLGQTGDWNGDDIVRFACAAPAHAPFIAGKVFGWLAWDDADESTIAPFAESYAASGNSLRELVGAILRSEAFYSDRARWAKVKSPVDFVVSSLRQLEISRDATRFAIGILAAQGQLPFDPPSVEGWPAGMTWLNSGTLLGRMNFASAASALADPVRVSASAGASGSELVAAMLDRFGLSTAVDSMPLEAYVSPGGTDPVGSERTSRVRGLAQLILSLPEWQLN